MIHILNKDVNKKLKTTTETRKRIIDNVTRLYVSFLRQDKDVNGKNIQISNSFRDSTVYDKDIDDTFYEINILFSLLTNIFRRETISWEVYIRDIVNSKIQLNHVISYLNEHLSSIDKIRILLSLIIMSSSSSEFSSQQITKILELAKRLDLETDGFMDVFNNLENKSLDYVSFKGHIHIDAIETSIFSDYVLFGKDEKCQIRFKEKSINNFEFILFMIDQSIFIGTNNRVSSYIDEKKLAPYELYLIPRHSTIKINEIHFNYEILVRLYHNQENHEIMNFKKDNFDFQITNNNNRFEMILNHGIVYRNKKPIPRNRSINLMYDDVFQIKGFPNFNVLEFFIANKEIGVINTVPDELYIDYSADYYSLSMIENANSIIMIEINNNKHVLYPPIKKSWELYLNNIKVVDPTLFYLNTDIITINKKNFRVNNFYDLVEIPFELENINVLDIKHYFNDGNLGLDSISFEIQKGDVLGILGQSGCGKSSLLKALSGEIFPTYGSIMYDGKSYYQNINFFSKFVGYVPQDDILFTHLTVYENLYYRGKLRSPKITDDHLEQKIDKILMLTNLIHKKHTKVGDLKNKLLSGGERKRLNLAIELLFDPTIIICDEPTSGLSYSDAEQIIDILKNFSKQGKFVILTIHQPNTNVFHKFDKVLIMDKGGKQVFFGTPNDVWTYFDMEFEQISSITHETDEKKENLESRKNTYYSAEVLEKKKQEKLPEYVSLIVEYPEYRENGEIIYEKIGRNFMIKRKYAPEYWRDKYKRKMLFDLIQFDNMRAKSNNTTIKQKKKNDLFDILVFDRQLLVFIRRTLAMKLRNHTNLLITFGQVILLSTIIAFILRLAPHNEAYSFHQNINLGIYLFISVIIFIFLGMSSSMEEILSEKKNFLREKMLDIKVSNFLYSKIAVLCLFASLQVIIYLAISCNILDIKGMFLIYFLYLFFASLIGSSLGIFISSFLSDSKSIINIIPLILIPQIIFGGAIIEFEKMNKNITFINSNPIPEIVKIMPSYWLFEGLYTAQAILNLHDRKMNHLDKQRKWLIQENKSTAILNKKIEEVHLKYPRTKYQNEYNRISVNIMDGKFLNTQKNVFLSSMKWVGKRTFDTFTFNLIIIILYIAIIVDATIIKLKFFYKD